jgi:hypothetical protein
MGRRKREGNYFPLPPKIKYCRISNKMKNTDTQTKTPTKQR